jgi:Flp pilus assembly protein TadD
MKKTLVVIGLAIAVCNAYAQNNNVVSANRHLSDFMSDHDSTDLKDAKTAIDQAATNDKTKNEPKMFLYRGQVYETLYETQISNISKKSLAAGGKMDQAAVQKAQTEGYLHADTSYLSTAMYSYVKVIMLEPKGDYAQQAMPALIQCIGHMTNKAVCEYNAGNYASAFEFFEGSYLGMKAMGMPDTSAQLRHLLQNTANSAEKAKLYPKAVIYYNAMVDIKAGKDVPYSSLNRIYMMQGDTTNALAIITKGRAVYPDDLNLLNAETNGYLWKRENDKAEGNLQLAIDKLTKMGNLNADQKDLLSRLYAILGGIFDRLANPRDAKNNNLPMPANYADMFQKADTNYHMALAIHPDDFDYNFDIGALYNNRAKYIYDQLTALPDKEQAKKSKIMEDDAKGWLKKAQPYLEKAYSLHGDDKALRGVLLRLYASTGQEDKAKALTDQK